MWVVRVCVCLRVCLYACMYVCMRFMFECVCVFCVCEGIRQGPVMGVRDQRLATVAIEYPRPKSRHRRGRRCCECVYCMELVGVP